MTTLAKTKASGNFFPSVFSDFFSNDKFFGPKWFEGEFEQTLPSVNIKENPQAFNIELAAPGFSKSDFKIDVEGDILTISASKKDEKDEKNDRYTRKEYFYNSFSRSFTLPQNLKTEKIDATYEDGILKLVLPKKRRGRTFLEERNKSRIRLFKGVWMNIRTP